MRSSTPQIRFFKWYYENVTLPTCDEIWRNYDKAIPSENPGVDITENSKFVLWGDSDILYLQQMTSP